MSLESLFSFLEVLDNALWSYIGFPAIMLFGLFLSFKTNFVHIRKLPYVIKSFCRLIGTRKEACEGVHPLKAFFTSIGGCLGIGNIVAICTAVQIGGPGALFWLWITAIAGMILKYSEVYLGMRYRIQKKDGSYRGGPMFFLRKVFKSKWVPKFVCVLLCIYGVEIYQFSVMSQSVSVNFELDRTLVTFFMLSLVIFASSGGLQRVGKISTAIIPLFIVLYLSMGAWVLVQNLTIIPGLLANVFTSAFTGHAAVGGFAGSSLLMVISQGIRRGCYSSDIGIGYASVIHSESSIKTPEKQALLAIFDIFLDSFTICTTSIMLILVTGVWKEPLPEMLLIQTALGQYFPYMNYFMPIFLFLLGYTTIIAYFCVGLKCAEHLHERFGKLIYYFYAIASMFVFSFVETREALIIMSITGAILMLINLYGIYKLRHEISFNFHKDTHDTTPAGHFEDNQPVAAFH